MQQKRLLTLSSCLLLVTLIVSGCETKNTVPKPDLFQYKGAYVGDNSAVGSILNQLPVTGYTKDFELQTKQEPYGIILNYDGSKTPQEQQEIIIYTATYLFTLIRNVDWITYNFDKQKYQISKAQLQQWYGKDFSQLQNDAQVDKLIQSRLQDKSSIDQLLHQ